MATPSLRLLAIPMVCWAVVTTSAPAGKTLHEQRQALLEQKVELLRAALARSEKLAAVGRLGPVELQEARLALVTAQLAAASDASERAKLHTKLIAIHEQRCRIVQAEFGAGRATQTAVLDAKLAVVQAKIDKENDAVGKPGTGGAAVEVRQKEPANR